MKKKGGREKKRERRGRENKRDALPEVAGTILTIKYICRERNETR